MIASTTVARWTWGREDESADALTCCLRDLLAAYGVLSVHRLAVGEHTVHISVTEAGRARTRLFEGEFTVSSEAASRPETVAWLADEVRAGMRTGEVGSVDARMACTGVVERPPHEAQQEELFSLSASSFADFVTVALSTRTDAWMPYDLRGRAQPEVYKANAPRLAAALDGLAAALGSDTDPDDPTYFGRPTETGIENFYESDGAASDVWGSFEIPYRNEVFHHTPRFQDDVYRRSMDGEVLYVPVRDEHGRVLGYLWASDAEGAASFEPRIDADDDGYRAGLLWLDRLHVLFQRRLSPSAALTEASNVPEESGSGRVDPAARPRTVDLIELRELAAGG
ncbi:hypothetical protein N8I84_15090 [Streptomyces cynarae]|uniref:Uncharacterized protein n=1 Tax=Streptomyces cynarae TaxID=2981134 RepID=A0ABY6E004_9ACTN|nr:hypothetical protein [Streptomyces cynarae]UXY19904.1 hypothetical protein N8I84_15090 [Streptomyces cynarae]